MFDIRCDDGEEEATKTNNGYRHMLLNQIELFVSVAKSQNLAKTARRIHVSPSSVSQRLKSLESEMGAKLYQKCKEGIKLTDAGRVLLETANEILTRIETVKKTINSRSPAKSRVAGGGRDVKSFSEISSISHSRVSEDSSARKNYISNHGEGKCRKNDAAVRH